jgi:hypothetical protein
MVQCKHQGHLSHVVLLSLQAEGMEPDTFFINCLSVLGTLSMDEWQKVLLMKDNSFPG